MPKPRKTAEIAALALCAGVLLAELFGRSGRAAAVLRVLRPVFAGIAIAYLVNIPSALLQKTVFGRMKRRRAAAVVSAVISYLFVFGLLALVLLLVVPRAVEGAGALLGSLGSFSAGLTERLSSLLGGLRLGEAADQSAAQLVSAAAERIRSTALEALPKLLDRAVSAAGSLANALLAATLSVYLLIDKNKLLAHARRLVRAVFSEERSERVLGLFTFANRTFRGYITGQLISCIVLGASCYIGMRLFGMPYPELISLLTAVLALIPILGPWISTLAGTLMILVAGRPALALWFPAMIFVLQQIDNSVVNPKLVGSAVGLSSAWVLLSVIAGGGLFGFTGLLLAVPVTAVLYRLAADWTNGRAKRRGVPIVEAVPEAGPPGRGGTPRRPFFAKKPEKKALGKAARRGE